MRRRDFLKSSAALTVSAALLNKKAFAVQPAHVWDRPLHIVYANTGGLTLDNTDQDILNAFADVTNGITAVTPFFLNVSDTSPYQSMITSLQGLNIGIVPGVGGDPTNGPLFTSANQAIAQGYSTFTKYIRLENMTGFLQNSGGHQDIQNMINYCVDLGFTHIMLNPWPKKSDGTAAQFTPLSVLDSSFNQVQLNYQKSGTYPVTPDPTNWLVNTTDVNIILAYNPTCRIVVNYESPGEHWALYYMEQDQKGSTQTAFGITVNQVQEYASSLNLHWAPPFTKIYDPLDLKTWGGISNKLSLFQ